MHGTGTQIGDPAEMGAVASIFKHRQGHNPLTVGAVKANVGHSEAAAGMASLLKCIMMFQKGIMPPQAGMPHKLNPKYPSLSQLHIEIPSEPKEFHSVNQKPRRILLNNFDAAGGNACVLLEDHPALDDKSQDPRPSHVIVTSAKTQASYHKNNTNLLEWLRANPSVRIEDIAYSTTARRMHHHIRFACTASTTQELITILEAVAPDTSPSRGLPVVFVFAGQGSHYAGMGSELYGTCPVFRERVDLCVSICEELNFPSFLDIITNRNIDISTKNTIQIQLAVVTLETGLASFWRSCGIQPSIVMGHSLGEYVALQVSGVFSLADMLYLVGHRALLIQERCEAGTCAMLAVSTSATAIQEFLNTRPHSSCGIACTNSPSATVISGSTDDIAELRKALPWRSTTLFGPYGFHSLQMDPLLDDYVSLAEGVTYSVPKIPVASTLLTSIVETSEVFSGAYLGQQTRQVVDFVGALKAVKDKLTDSIWLEIGPGQICSSFVRATISSSPGRIMSTLEARTNAWVSISKCLSGAYKEGIAIDWLAFHAPFTAYLKLLTLPPYAWDLKDFWIVYTESKQQTRVPAPAHELERKISTCAQYVVQETSSPKIQVTLRASIADPSFLALIDGHRMRGVSVCPGSAFCEAGLAAAKYVRQHSVRNGATNAKLTVRNLSLKRPLTKNLVGSEGELVTTVVTEKSSSDSIQVSWKASSKQSSYDLGNCVVAVCDADSLQAGWDRTSYFIKARMDELTKNAKDGSGHRMLPSILYALFSSTVEYDTAFKCIKEAFISSDFKEAVAEVVLQNDPPGSQFVSSPYWGESLVHLAGFLVNSNPYRQAANTTFIMETFESFEQTFTLESGKPYFTYVRVSQRQKDATNCDVFVFDSEKLVMQCCGLRFHEVSNVILDRVLGKSIFNSGHVSQLQNEEALGSEHSPGNLLEAQEAQKVSESSESGGEETIASDTRIFHIILESISKETGIQISDLHDDAVLVELGLDSIMSIEIATRVTDRTGLDILPSFVVDYPTIGDLRNAFTLLSTSTPPGQHLSNLTPSTSTLKLAPSSSVSLVDNISKNHISALDVEETVTVQSPVQDNSPAPRARITLLQGSPSGGKLPFYLIADGTGSIATYIHLPLFKSRMPVYGIDSPFLRCPSRLTVKVGIPGSAKFIVEALVKAQPEGPFSIGGYSGGAMLGYEVCHQLAAAGRIVDSFLLIDMCNPRPTVAVDAVGVGWSIYESIASQNGLWNASEVTQQHLRAVFACVAAYQPHPMAVQDRPKRTAIIWAKRGMIERCSHNPKLMQLLADHGIPTEPYAGFMEDPKMGVAAWGLPRKTTADLGPNGWDRYVGDTLCLSINADHLEMPMPGHVHLLHGAMEEALTYLNGPDN